MLKTLIGKLTNSNEFKLDELKSILKLVNSHEPNFENLSSEDILNKTKAWQEYFAFNNFDEIILQKELNKILPEAYALVRECAKRVLNQRIRDVQILAGIALHQGKIAEQKTGEGKTLTAVAPLYLNALTGRGVHIVTPNDYLSRIAPGWYGKLYETLGVSVGVNVSEGKSYMYDSNYTDDTIEDNYAKHLKRISRREAYLCDITYGTNHEYGFDYLRDNMSKDISDIVQINKKGIIGDHYFAIVDEVDNILIDIARTPLIISQPKELSSSLYHKYAQLASELVQKTDYTIDEKEKHVTLTELGISKIERKLNVSNLYEKDFETIHHIENALRAKTLMIKDRDYVVKNGEVVIIDQNTGRLLQDNRWSNGLHQAVEAKENVEIKQESKTVATISYQNYFRLYKKLSGMTGTALTESEEFMKMYSLEVISIPTFKPVARVDHKDIIFKTETAKFRAIANDIKERNIKGQPVLIGTTSVEKSQLLSTLLKKLNIKHEILNAKNHEREAQIISKAGSKSSVTVSTNMAGRGVDIILGGDFSEDSKSHDEVVALGGLYVIGTERHESRRIDNQLRGRSGRQGDIGESRFYLSLQDDLLRIFGGDAIARVMNAMRMDDNMPIESGIITKSIENAQKKVEGMNFDQRRRTVEYDDVMNVQRNAIYRMRRRILIAGSDIQSDKDSEYSEFLNWALGRIAQHTNRDAKEFFTGKTKDHGLEIWFLVTKRVILDVIDVLWTDHIDTMENLSYAVRLRGYGQVDPLIEYKREGRLMFERLLREIWMSVVERLYKVEVTIESNLPKSEELKSLEYSKDKFESGVANEASEIINSSVVKNNTGSNQVEIDYTKVKRNDPCPCGSGKKFKKCHGK